MKTTLVATLAASALLALSAAKQSFAQNYAGVAPGSDVVPENIASAPGEEPVVTWPGFQLLPDGSSRVFVQTSIEVKPELKRDGARWRVLISGVALPEGNARLPLDTHYFNTPVTSVRAKPGATGVTLILEMRANLVPKLRTEKAANGYFFTLIEFPAGDYL